MIVDAHAHIFSAVRGLTSAGATRGAGFGRVMVGNQEPIQLLPPYHPGTCFTPEMLLANMDWAGIEKAVLLQGPFYGECNNEVAEALHRYGHRLIGAAYYDPWSKTANSSNLLSLLDAAPFRAVKLECSTATGLCGLHPTARLDQSEIAWLWAILERRGLVLVLDLGAVGSRSYQTAAVDAIARRHPTLRIVIAHLGQPRPTMAQDKELHESWVRQIALGELPNIWFDCAALPAYFPDEFIPYTSTERYLRAAIAHIGADKILWGTDQPGLLSVASLPQLLRMAQIHINFLSDHDQRLLLGENARLVFDL